MLRTSLIFVVIALLALPFTDLEITTSHPWTELGQISLGAIQPDLQSLWQLKTALLNTVVFAFCGISIGVVLGMSLAFGFSWAPIRLFCVFIRSIHEIFWAFIFLNIVGLNPICGVLSIAIPYAGIFAKVYAEIVQESDKQPQAGIPTNVGAISRFVYGVLPVIYADAKHYTAYRFECALRSSAILGFIGLPTLGYHLETAFREGTYQTAWALLYAFYLLIASLKYWLQPRLIPFYVGGAFTLLSQEVTVSWANVLRFFTVDILPWPMRRVGVSSGTHHIDFSPVPVLEWIKDILITEGAEGVWNTLILTQIVLVGTGFFALLVFPFTCRHFSRWPMRSISQYVLVVLRTTPEYLLAYVFVQLWGPSMIPAVCAILLHNGGILAFLTSNNADRLHAQIDSPFRYLDRYFYEVLPRIYGQFLAFLFYRWEVMVRESAILGVLGIYTLGFYIDSAIVDNQLDKAALLILLTATLNMSIDVVSQRVRRRLQISTKLFVSD